MSSLPDNRNGAWDRALVDTLMACGVRRTVLCPGGRSSMLAMMLDRTPGMECILHIDERSGGFVALGMILADGSPTAICTTSGTAVANLLPALAEAQARGMPIVLLTCDRPRTGLLPGEPQWLPQVALCAALARSQLALPDPFDGTMTSGELRDAVVAALATGLGGSQPGPIHINIPQWGDYCATETDPPGLAPPSFAGLPSVAMTEAPDQPDTDLAAVTRSLERMGVGRGARGVVLACADQPLPPTALVEFLALTDYPLIADVASGLRRCAMTGLMTTADALAEADLLALDRADILIRIGGTPVCPGLARAVKAMRCPVIKLARHAPGPDALTPHAIGFWPPRAEEFVALGRVLGAGDPQWAAEWRILEAIATATRDIAVATAEWGELVAVSRICAAPGFAAMHCANSLSIRLAGFAMSSGVGSARLFSARGVNGTDGTLGLVLGEALALGAPMLALLGDQAFTHDLPALANPLWRTVKGALCVINNAGGGIFDLTAVRHIDRYEATMRNPPAIDLAGIAQAFSLTHRVCGDRSTLDAALEDAGRADGLYCIDIRVPAGTSARDLPRLLNSIRTSCLAAKGSARGNRMP